MYEPSDDEVDQAMAALIGNGFFDLVAGDDGSVLYRVSKNAKEISPVLYGLIYKQMNEELMEFARLGYIEYRLSDNLELEYRWTEKGKEFMEESGYTFDD